MEKLRFTGGALLLGLLFLVLLGPAWGSPPAQGDNVAVFGVT
jgi:hypothetical protein